MSTRLYDIERDVFIDQVYNAIHSVLSDIEYRVFMLLQHGYSLLEIASLQDSCVTVVKIVVESMRRKIIGSGIITRELLI